MILHLYLVRHGQTYFNRYNRLQGWSNSPLTQKGLDDADRAAHKLISIEFAAAYCSDTTRAQTTAEHILTVNHQAGHPQVELITDMHFREQFYGYYEGQDMGTTWWAAGAPHGVGTYEQIVQRFGLPATKDFLKEVDPFHDAESDREYWDRIDDGYRLIAANPTVKDGDSILQISHGNTLLSLMNRYAPQGYDLSKRPANGSITQFDFDTEKPIETALRLVSYNR